MTSSEVSRRDFLKIAGLLPLGLAKPRWMENLSAHGGRQNVIVLVFDAFSAYNISLYGYARETTPNLAHLAKSATVYHNHFAGSNFTTSGTASLLTGTLPWTHRALLPGGRVAEAFVRRSMFRAFADYYRVAYTHNGWAYTLLRQFRQDVDNLIPTGKLLLGSTDSLIETLFPNDEDIADVSWVRNLRIADQGYAYSLFLSHLYKALQERRVSNLNVLFPRGLPTAGPASPFLLEEAVDWLGHLVTLIPQPFFGYFHFLPPHDPYTTALEFYNRFKADGYKPIDKPKDIFAPEELGVNLYGERRWYDEYLLYVDREIGRFYYSLEAAGLLENTWVVLTSDHGEMFERGISGHKTDVLYEPVIRIPLLIFEPGKQARTDIHLLTSAVDVLPTLAQLTGHVIPDWVEGTVLPPYAPGGTTVSRSVYAMVATKNDPMMPLTRATTTLVTGRYKLIYYVGYADLGIDDLVKLYDVESDPEELQDLSSQQPDITAELLRQLKAKIHEVNQPYV